MARLSKELLEAYRATSYTAETPGGVIVLRVGEKCPELWELMREHGAKTAAYITAVNPGSVQLSEEENAARLAELDAVLERDGFMVFKGCAVADAGDWPDEESRLVLGVKRSTASYWAREFHQNAYLRVSAEDGVVRLMRRDLFWVFICLMVSLILLMLLVLPVSLFIGWIAWLFCLAGLLWMRKLALYVGYREVGEI